MSDQAKQCIARQLEVPSRRFDDLEGQVMMPEATLMRVEARLHRLVGEMRGLTTVTIIR